jgi:hypothetical protein
LVSQTSFGSSNWRASSNFIQVSLFAKGYF